VRGENIMDRDVLWLRHMGGCRVTLKRDNREIDEMITKSSVGNVGNANEINSMPKHELKGGSCDDRDDKKSSFL